MFTTLISVENLARHLGDPTWILFDCRHDLPKPESGRAAYHAGHIPGARFAHLDEDLSGPKTGRNGRHPLPARDTWVRFLRASGVDPNSQVVAYDASGGMFAARLWWQTRWIGHEAVAVLDGGLPAWERAGLPQNNSPASLKTGHIVAAPSLTAITDVDAIRANLTTQAQLIVDARAPERYRGDIEPLDRVGGHIPGALNHFYQNNLERDARFLPGSQLRDQFRALIGEREASSIVHQCGSGVSACHNLLAMQVAGLHGSALYPGSWSQWCADPERPVAAGPATS